MFHSSDRIVWLITFLSGAPEIIGTEGQNKGLDFILTRKIDSQNTVHGIEARLNLISQIGAGTNNKTTSVYLDGGDREPASSFLENNGIKKDSLLIGLHPGAQKPFKCWPPERFVELGRLLAGRFGCRIVVTGNRGEKPLADKIASEIEGAVSAAGRLTLRETAAVIEKVNVFITNDTGPMHIAFALKIPTVALFSPTDPKLCGPCQAKGAVVIEKPKTCKPCIGKKCYNPVCMEQITPQEIVAAVETLLGKPNKDADSSELQT
ncbi:MAG: glycosyltransferase family 9 protein [Nitrospirae bacterium]|nr:glycosyltransferase family 9 protein [Nitrospirota bacterium]MCL5237426.1 glycosyltransferase family 9 protein [Nitrospirota bacterium]